MSTQARAARVRRFGSALALAAAIVCRAPAAAETTYWELAADDFVIVSAAGEQRTREIAARLSMFKTAMESIFGMRVNLATPTRIHALSAADWTRYAQPRPEVAGYFVAHPFASDLLFDVQAEDPRAYELMLHEYTHHVLRSLSSGRYPAFFDEGLAEVFSTATLSNSVVRFAPRPEYVAFLRRREWLPFERLLDIERRDPEYVDHTLAPAFYAQAWATMYYAVAANVPYSNRLLDYIRDLNSGVPREEAVEALIGDTISHANRDIARFVLARKALPLAQIGVGGVPDEQDFPLRRLRESERAVLLAELQIRLGNRSEAALALLRSVRSGDADVVRARIGQGLAHLQAGNRDAALTALDGVAPSADLTPAEAVMLGRGLLELSRRVAEGDLSPAERERVTRARALFRGALDDRRNWIEATHGYVLASLALEAHDASVMAVASKAYAAAPKNAELAVSLAILHELGGEKAAARRYWTEAARNLHEGPARTRILRGLAVEEPSAQR